jgi:hypothetical protein
MILDLGINVLKLSDEYNRTQEIEMSLQAGSSSNGCFVFRKCPVRISTAF